MFRAANAPFLSNLTFLSCALFSFLLFVVNILRTAFFAFYAFSSLFEYCDRIKHIACFLLCFLLCLIYYLPLFVQVYICFLR